MNKLKSLLTLFLTMFKIGAFTFGGGFAMMVLMEHELIDKRKWIERDDFYDLVAVAESTPGPIAINAATFIGYKVAGVLGSIFATLGVALPSFIIIYVISLFFEAFLQITLVANAFKGIQACVAFLIFSAGVKMVKKLKSKPLPIILFVLTTACYLTLSLFGIKFSSIFYILIGAGLSVIVYLITLAVNKMKKGENK